MTPQQTQRFESALMKFAQANFDVGASAMEQGISQFDPAILNTYAKNRADMATALQGIVTPQ